MPQPLPWEGQDWSNHPFVSGLSALMGTLGLPGDYIRGLLAGRPGERLSGEELLRGWGDTDPSALASMATSMGTDPLMLLGAAAPALRLARGIGGAAEATPFLKSAAFNFGLPLAGAGLMDASRGQDVPGIDAIATGLMMAPLAHGAYGLARGMMGRGAVPGAAEFAARQGMPDAAPHLPEMTGYQGAEGYMNTGATAVGDDAVEAMLPGGMTHGYPPMPTESLQATQMPTMQESGPPFGGLGLGGGQAAYAPEAWQVPTTSQELAQYVVAMGGQQGEAGIPPRLQNLAPENAALATGRYEPERGLGQGGEFLPYQQVEAELPRRPMVPRMPPPAAPQAAPVPPPESPLAMAARMAGVTSGVPDDMVQAMLRYHGIGAPEEYGEQTGLGQVRAALPQAGAAAPSPLPAGMPKPATAAAPAAPPTDLIDRTTPALAGVPRPAAPESPAMLHIAPSRSLEELNQKLGSILQGYNIQEPDVPSVAYGGKLGGMTSMEPPMPGGEKAPVLPYGMEAGSQGPAFEPFTPMTYSAGREGKRATVAPHAYTSPEAAHVAQMREAAAQIEDIGKGQSLKGVPEELRQQIRSAQRRGDTQAENEAWNRARKYGSTNPDDLKNLAKALSPPEEPTAPQPQLPEDYRNVERELTETRRRIGQINDLSRRTREQIQERTQLLGRAQTLENQLRTIKQSPAGIPGGPRPLAGGKTAEEYLAGLPPDMQALVLRNLDIERMKEAGVTRDQLAAQNLGAIRNNPDVLRKIGFTGNPQDVIARAEEVMQSGGPGSKQRFNEWVGPATGETVAPTDQLEQAIQQASAAQMAKLGQRVLPQDLAEGLVGTGGTSAHLELERQMAPMITRYRELTKLQRSGNITAAQEAQRDWLLDELKKLESQRNKIVSMSMIRPEVPTSIIAEPGGIRHREAVEKWKPGQPGSLGRTQFHERAIQGAGNIEDLEQVSKAGLSPQYGGPGPEEQAMQAEELARAMGQPAEIGRSTIPPVQMPPTIGGMPGALRGQLGYQPQGITEEQAMQLVRALGITNPAILAMLLGGGGLSLARGLMQPQQQAA